MRPSGVDMSVSSATVGTPASPPRPTIVRASSRACSGSFMNAPEPTLTSRTRPPVPSAIFLLMIELAINGIDSTVAVTSRKEYSLRSAGARPEPAAQITAPTSTRICRICSLDSDACQPGTDSSLSSVPPVWPRPRPDSCGTATPHAATSGASGSVILSPTPPVECLSMLGLPRSLKSSRSPEAIIARVQAEVSARSMPRRNTAIARADICSSATTPRVYASRTHSICSSLSARPSRLVRMTSTASNASVRDVDTARSMSCNGCRHAHSSPRRYGRPAAAGGLSRCEDAASTTSVTM